MLILAAAIAKAERQRRFRPPTLAAADHLGRVPATRRVRPGQPAVHRRLRRPPGAQRQPFDQGDRRPWAATAKLAGATGRLGSRRKEYLDLARELAGKWIEAAADGDHTSLTFDKQDTLEPEIQPGLGPAAGARTCFRPKWPKGDRFLPRRSRTSSACRSTAARPTPRATGSCGPPRMARSRGAIFRP